MLLVLSPGGKNNTLIGQFRQAELESKNLINIRWRSMDVVYVNTRITNAQKSLFSLQHWMGMGMEMRLPHACTPSIHQVSGAGHRVILLCVIRYHHHLHTIAFVLTRVLHPDCHSLCCYPSFMSICCARALSLMRLANNNSVAICAHC